MEKPFADYFSDDVIIAELCKFRVRLAKRRNDSLFLHRIAGGRKLADSHPLNIFPPRKLWNRFRNKHRKGQPSTKLNIIALQRAIKKLRTERPDEPWAVALASKVESIRTRALSLHFSFREPQIIPEEKERGKPEHRPIANFALDDKIIDVLTARYFREMLDAVFDESSLAFRCPKPGKPAPQFHDALDKILNLRRRHARTGMFVAECDIKGFFDCVSHEIAAESLEFAIHSLRKRVPGFTIDPQAVRVFDAYLACYSFPETVRRKAQPRLQRRKPGAIFKWPETDLQRFYSDPDEVRIGVPQGGALSCLIANCVLHKADLAVRTARRKCTSTFTYRRYCDDMIILARERASCATAFQAYQDALHRLKLPVHVPAEFLHYTGKQFWDGKSRQPYLWFGPAPGCIPWIQFVGYQIRHDGCVRVRNRSLKKHMRKLTAEADALLAILCPIRSPHGVPPVFATSIRKRKTQILHRFRHKLISLSVGRRNLSQRIQGPLPMSWVSGYKGLHGKKVVPSMLKALDRHRERQIRRVQRRIGTMPKPAEVKKGVDIKTPRYYGAHFSYVSQLRKSQMPRARRPST